jgi:hemerythrin-like domain-containing protein
MRYSKPCQMLVDEHEVILSVIEAVEAVAQRPDNDALADGFFERACDFFATFADKCHHGKEEVHLFPMLESRGIPRQGGPIGCMLHDHDAGRAHIQAVRAALGRAREGDPAAPVVAKLEALAFCDLLRQHIEKENQVLFVIGDRVMDAADKELLLKRFNCAEHGALPPGTHEKYTSIARELREAAGLEETSPTHLREQALTSHLCHCNH